MAETNAVILDAIWAAGTNEYQQTIPATTQGGIAQTMAALQDPANIQFWNMFVSNLIQRIGDTRINQVQFQNPLAPFKRGMLRAGSSIQEIAYHLIKAKGYDQFAETLLKQYPPEIEMKLHQISRQDKFAISINQSQLQQAFLDEYGLNNFINGALAIPTLSDNEAEFRAMLQLIAEYEDAFGFYKINCPDLSVLDATETDAKQFLKLVRATTGKLQFLKGRYNFAGVPTRSMPNDLYLLATPDVIANIDVEALAGAFNVSMADIKSRVIVVDEFPIQGCQALLVDKDWFVCADVVFQTNTFYNPETLSTTYYLHHWSILSASALINAIMFTTNEGTVEMIGELVVDGAELVIAPLPNGTTPTSAVRGKQLQLAAIVTGTVTTGDQRPNGRAFSSDVIVPQGAVFKIISSDHALSSFTHVDRFGLLFIGSNELATELTVEITATYIDPDTNIASQTPFTADLMIDIVDA